MKAQQKWLAKLMGYNFVIEYNKGRESSAADSLSRCEEGTCMEHKVFALSMPLPMWIDAIREEVQNEPKLQILAKNIQAGEAIGLWSIKSGIIFYKDNIYLRATSPLTQLIISEFHAGTHEGFHKTWQQLKSVFYWRGVMS